MSASVAPEAADRALRAQHVGRVGCHVLGRTHVALVPYVYTGTALLLCLEPGLELRMMRLNPSVCFEVDDVDSLPWTSVSVGAEFRELSGAEAEEARGRFLAELEDRLAARFGREAAREHVSGYGRGTPARLEIVARRGATVRPAGASSPAATAA